MNGTHFLIETKGREDVDVAHLGTDEPTETLLTSVLGAAFASGRGRPPLLREDSC